jgi:hypothetical protein
LIHRQAKAKLPHLYFVQFASNGSTPGSSLHDRKCFVAAYALALASAMPEVDVTWQILEKAGLNSR